MEVLYGYPIDGVVLTIGCDKTTPAALMAAATVNIPAITLWWADAQRLVPRRANWLWNHRLASTRNDGSWEIDYPGFVDLVASSAPPPATAIQWGQQQR